MDIRNDVVHDGAGKNWAQPTDWRFLVIRPYHLKSISTFELFDRMKEVFARCPMYLCMLLWVVGYALDESQGTVRSNVKNLLDTSKPDGTDGGFTEGNTWARSHD